MSDFDLGDQISNAEEDDESSDESEVERAPPPNEVEGGETENETEANDSGSMLSGDDGDSSGSAFTSDDDSPFTSDEGDVDPFADTETPDVSEALEEVDEDKEPEVIPADESTPSEAPQNDDAEDDSSDEGETSDEVKESVETDSDNADDDSDEEQQEEVVSSGLEDELPDADDTDTVSDDDDGEDTESVEWGGDGPAPNVDQNGASASESDSEPEPDSETESEDTNPMSDSNGSSGIDVKSIASNVMTASEAAETDQRFTIMVWADPGQGKTHFACTMPSPVVIIDTEGKAEEVTRKFHKEGQYDDPFIFQPSNYDEASEALTQGMKILHEFKEEEGVIGTLAVDSMSIMWDWAQQKYVDKFYKGKDKSEVDFDSAIGGGQSDWKVIKRLHNAQFRQDMLDSPFHLCWTAMREDDYEERMKGNRDADKPAGEKENVYKVDEVIRVTEGPDGAPVGVLNKSGKIKHRYVGYRYVEFPDHKELIDQIREAERGDGAISPLEKSHDVQIVEGSPMSKNSDD